MQKDKPKHRKTVLRKPSSYQPSKAELEADVSIPTTPDKLLRAVINYNPRKHLFDIKQGE